MSGTGLLNKTMVDVRESFDNAFILLLLYNCTGSLSPSQFLRACVSKCVATEQCPTGRALITWQRSASVSHLYRGNADLNQEMPWIPMQVISFISWGYTDLTNPVYLFILNELVHVSHCGHWSTNRTTWVCFSPRP